jgi:hypothetical protein
MAIFSGPQVVVTVKSCSITKSSASFFHDTSAAAKASIARPMVNQALSLSHDFFSPRETSCSMTSLQFERVEASVFEDAEVGRGAVRTSRPERMTDMRPKRRAKSMSRSSCPVMDPSGLLLEAIMERIWSHVTVSIRDNNWSQLEDENSSR